MNHVLKVTIYVIALIFQESRDQYFEVIQKVYPRGDLGTKLMKTEIEYLDLDHNPVRLSIIQSENQAMDKGGKERCKITCHQTRLWLDKLAQLGKVSKKEKKVRNFPHFSGVGWLDKVIFRKKKYGLKMHKIS